MINADELDDEDDEDDDDDDDDDEDDECFLGFFFFGVFPPSSLAQRFDFAFALKIKTLLKNCTANDRCFPL